VDEPLWLLFRRALDLVRAQRPRAFSAMATSLAGLAVSFSFAEGLHLRGECGDLREQSANELATLRLRASRGALQALVTGRVTLHDSLRTGAIDAAGSTDALSSALSAIECFVCALLTIDDAEDLRRALEGL
jgi:hypothetical protein